MIIFMIFLFGIQQSNDRSSAALTFVTESNVKFSAGVSGIPEYFIIFINKYMFGYFEKKRKG